MSNRRETIIEDPDEQQNDEHERISYLIEIKDFSIQQQNISCHV